MADAKKKTEGDGEAEAPKKKSKLLLIIIIAVVSIALIGGGAAFFLMKKQPAAEDEEGDEPAAEERAKKPKKAHNDAPPVFVKLDAFVVKLQSEGVDAYLQAIPELRVLDAHTGERIKQYNAEIRHKVLLILAGKRASELGTPEGMQKLSNEMRVTINHILEPPAPRKKGAKAAAEEPDDHAGPDDPVQSVLFTSFIVQ
jgi:flagellar FliL protein